MAEQRQKFASIRFDEHQLDFGVHERELRDHIMKRTP